MLTQIPERARQVLYSIYAALVFLAGGLTVAYNSAGNGQPTWLDVSLDVLAYAGAALGITAAANVGNVGPPPPAIGGEHVADERGQYDPIRLLIGLVVLVVAVIVIVWLVKALAHHDHADAVTLLLLR